MDKGDVLDELNLSEYECKLYSDDENDTNAFDEILNSTFNSKLASKSKMPTKLKKNQPLCSTRIENIDHKVFKTTIEETFNEDRISLNEKSENEELVESQLNDSNLTSYEQWMMKKMKIAKEKENQKKEEEKQKRRKKKVEEMHKEHVRKCRLAEHERWLDNKNNALRKSLKKEGTKKRKEEQAVEIKKKEVRAKAEVEYNKWMKQYKMKKKMLEDDQKQKDEQQKKLELEKKQKSEESFKQWLEEKKKQKFIIPPPDKYPEPGYINPKPWIAPDIDRSQKTKAKQIKTNKKKLISVKTPKITKNEIRKNANSMGLLRPHTTKLSSSTRLSATRLMKESFN